MIHLEIQHHQHIATKVMKKISSIIFVISVLLFSLISKCNAQEFSFTEIQGNMVPVVNHEDYLNIQILEKISVHDLIQPESWIQLKSLLGEPDVHELNHLITGSVRRLEFQKNEFNYEEISNKQILTRAIIKSPGAAMEILGTKVTIGMSLEDFLSHFPSLTDHYTDNHQFNFVVYAPGRQASDPVLSDSESFRIEINPDTQKVSAIFLSRRLI